MNNDTLKPRDNGIHSNEPSTIKTVKNTNIFAWCGHMILCPYSS